MMSETVSMRSNLALARLIGVPYGALLVLYLVLLGGGGLWVHDELRAVEAEVQIGRLTEKIDPLARRFAEADASDAARVPGTALLAEVGALFETLEELETVSLRDAAGGWIVEGGAGDPVTGLPRVRTIPGEEVERSERERNSPERLLERSDEPLFVLRFDLEGGAGGLARLDVALRRGTLIARVDAALSRLRRVLGTLALAGTSGIALAALITLQAMRTTRRLESHFQTLHRRAALTETAAALVHELRNPLAALRANVAALRLAPEDRREILDELDADILSLDAKLDAFLGLTRHHAAPPEPLDPGTLVREAVRLARPVLARRGLDIELALEEPLPTVPIRRQPLQDALLNLIVNAGQSGQREGAVRVGARADERTLELWVEDRGEGVTARDLPHLLEPFYTTREKGNGIGLAIARRTLAAHEGTVRVENRAGGGVRATLALPRRTRRIPPWWRRLQKGSPT